MNSFLETIRNLFLGSFGFLLGIVFLGFGAIQIYLGFIGIEYHLGGWFAIGAVALAFLFRIMFPLIIGTYFGVVDVLGYEWYLGIIFAAPGILFMLPATLSLIIGTLFYRERY